LIELCPKCASEEITDPETGWGPKCASEAVVEQYVERETKAAGERHQKWKQRSDSPEALKWRQRKHRLYAAVQPRERPDRYTDPWELAHEGLKELWHLKNSVRGDRGRAHLEAVAECIKQLAVGPDSDGQIPVKESSGRKPRKRRVASRTFTCQVCGEKFKAIRDAKYCSSACNVAAYRQRKRASAS
jgi:hypothetical protein